MAKRPLYKEVREQLTKSLIEGEWRPGAMLPSEPQLAKRYGVGISTIRAALHELERANVLVRAQGKGTFVARFDERANTHLFLNVVREDGVLEEPHRRLLSCVRIEAPAPIAEALRLPRRDAQVFHVTTLVSLAGTPVYHSQVYLPVRLFARLRKALLPDGNRSLYSLYQQHFNVNVIRVVDSLHAAPAPALVSKLCELPARAAVVRLNRIAYTYNDVCVEVRQNWINTAHHCYRIEQGNAG